MNLRKRLDAISTRFKFHQEFLQVLQQKALEYLNSESNTSDSDQDENDKTNEIYKADDTENSTPLNQENSKVESINAQQVRKKIVSRTTMAYITNIQHNFDSLFALEIAKLELAININNKVLSLAPDNFNALWIRAALLLTSNIDESNISINTEVEKILDRLENDITRNDNLMLMAKAEIAGMYEPAWLARNLDLLLKCAALYEECIKHVSSDDAAQSGIKDLSQFLKQRLVEIYSWISYGQKCAEAVEMGTRYVQEINDDPSIPNAMKAKSWTNLAVIIQHGQPRHERTYTYSPSADQPTSFYCFARALELDPTNPRILLQVGRELRRRPGSTARDIELAISYLQRALDDTSIPDLHEYILHHMGLAYKSLWILNDQPQHDRRAEERFYFVRKPYRGNEEDRPSFGCRVIKPPCEPFESDRIPSPYKEAGKGAFYRFFNQIARDPRNEYLLQAKNCFQRAIDICFEKCLYLVDLARLQISSGNVKEAGDCLIEAQTCEFSDITSTDAVGVNLFEQLGYYEELKMMRAEFNDAKAEEVKSLYREAIRQSTQNKWKPVVAAHHILRILHKQLALNKSRSRMDHMILQDEYFLLYMTIQEVENDRDIVKSFTSDEIKIGIMWRLIKMFQDINQAFDAAAGFTYLSVLYVFEKFETEINGIEMTLVEKQRMLLKLAERVAVERTSPTNTRFNPDEYKMLSDLALLEETLNFSAASNELTEHEKTRLDIVNDIVCPALIIGFIRSTEQC